MNALKLMGRTGKVAGQDKIVQEGLRIGAAADNDFQVAVAGVSRHHARIVREGDAYVLEDAGSTNGTFLNGQRISRERLRHLDVITLGRDVDLISVEMGQAPSGIVQRAVEDAWLEPIEGQAGSPRVELPLGEVTIGRVAPSNVLLESPLVSQLHARLERTNDHVVVQDLGSVNGTFVNGAAVREPTELNDGDTLVIAGIRHFRVHIAGRLDRRPKAPEPAASKTMMFDSGWKTRLVWSADEMAEFEAERQRILASVRKESAAADPRPKAAPPTKPAAPAAAKAEAAPGAPAPPAGAPKPAPAPPRPAAAAPPPAAAPPAQPPAPAEAPTKPPTGAAAAAIAAARAGKTSVPTGPSPDAVTVLRAPALRALRLKGEKGTFELTAGRHAVGRAEGVPVSILDPQVSRAHAVILVTPSEVRVEDSESANGTLVNGVKLVPGGAGSVALKTGDRLAFGKVEFTVELIS